MAAAVEAAKETCGEPFWRRLIEEQARGGGPASKFCKRRGVSQWSFYRWRALLRRRDRAQQLGRSKVAVPRQPPRASSESTAAAPVVLKAKRQQQARGEAFWRDLVERWSKSGEGVTAFAHKEGVSRSTFSTWRARFESRGATGLGQPAKLLPVRVVQGHPAPATDATVEIVVGERRIRVAPGFDAGALERVIRVLESMPC